MTLAVACMSSVTAAPEVLPARNSNSYATMRWLRSRMGGRARNMFWTVMELQPQVFPQRIDTCFDVGIHHDRRAPFADGFARPLVGGVDAHFAAESGHGTGEVEIVDRRVFHQQRVACRVAARRARAL